MMYSHELVATSACAKAGYGPPTFCLLQLAQGTYASQAVATMI